MKKNVLICEGSQESARDTKRRPWEASWAWANRPVHWKSLDYDENRRHMTGWGIIWAFGEISTIFIKYACILIHCVAGDHLKLRRRNDNLVMSVLFSAWLRHIKFDDTFGLDEVISATVFDKSLLNNVFTRFMVAAISHDLLAVFSTFRECCVEAQHVFCYWLRQDVLLWG
jgi:hypothetical protein